MTVQDLINALTAFDRDLPVVMPSETGAEFCGVEMALLDLVRFIDGGAELTDERETDRTPVVRLFGPDV